MRSKSGMMTTSTGEQVPSGLKESNHRRRWVLTGIGALALTGAIVLPNVFSHNSTKAATTTTTEAASIPKKATKPKPHGPVDHRLPFRATIGNKKLSCLVGIIKVQPGDTLTSIVRKAQDPNDSALFDARLSETAQFNIDRKVIPDADTLKANQLLFDLEACVLYVPEANGKAMEHVQTPPAVVEVAAMPAAA